MSKLTTCFLALTLLLISGCVNVVRETTIGSDNREYLLRKINNYPELIKLYREKLSKKENSQIRLRLAEYYYLVDDYESSLHYLSPLLNKNTNTQVFKLYAKNLYEIGKNDKAIQILKKSILLDSKDGEAYNLLGIIYAENGQLIQAVESFNEARKNFFDEEKVINNLAMLKIVEGKYSEAYDYLMPLYQRGHNSNILLSNLIYVLVKLKDYESASNLMLNSGLIKDNKDPIDVIRELDSISPKLKEERKQAKESSIKGGFVNENKTINEAKTTTVNNENKLAPLIEENKNSNNQSIDSKENENINQRQTNKKQDNVVDNGSIKESNINNSTNAKENNINSKQHHNEIIDLRFGLHRSFLRLAIESNKVIHYKEVFKDKRAYFIELHDVLISEEMLNKIVNGNRFAKNRLDRISVSQQDNNVLLKFYFKKHVKMNIYRIPSKNKMTDRLVFDIY